MYSAPKYGELDPNGILALFFSIFFGFIMADIGYGLVLVVFGLILALKQKKKTGPKQLWTVIAIGGLFSVLFGIGFGSFFGLSHENFWLVPQAIIPNPVDNVMTLLIACLGAGIVQIMVSFILQGILLIRRKKVFDVICFAFSWDFFFVGLILFALDFMGITSGLTMVGIIIALSSVAICLIGQIVKNKGFNKFTKSFGALYGIINMFSDILSYARLFGLTTAILPCQTDTPPPRLPRLRQERATRKKRGHPLPFPKRSDVPRTIQRSKVPPPMHLRLCRIP